MKPTGDHDEADLTDAMSKAIFAALMDISDGEPGFVGAVLTLTMGRVLALLDDDFAKRCIDMHTDKAMQFRNLLRKPHAKN